jgi:ubiquinol-cytochrome c reductase cytochrome b subunit
LPTIYKFSKNISNKKIRDLQTKNKFFNQWLAGIIDGVGSLQISKKGYTSLEITMGISDFSALNKIKTIFGGSIKVRNGVKAYRYRLHNKKGILQIITKINGQIRFLNQQKQLQQILKQFQIEYFVPNPLTVDNA